MPVKRDPVSSTPWRVVDLPTAIDARGSLTICESGAQLDYPVQRVRWVHGVPPDAARGGHAHWRTTQLFVAATGRIVVTVDDGTTREDVALDAPSRGLLVPPLVWIETGHFSPGAVLLMLASERHDPADYIRDYRALTGARGSGSGRSATT